MLACHRRLRKLLAHLTVETYLILLLNILVLCSMSSSSSVNSDIFGKDQYVRVVALSVYSVTQDYVACNHWQLFNDLILISATGGIETHQSHGER